MKRTFLRGTVLGFILWAALPMGTAHAAPSVSISWPSGKQAAGSIDISWTASSSSGMRWGRAELLGNSHAPTGCRDDASSPDCSGEYPQFPTAPNYQTTIGADWTWNTNSLTPWNGSYTFRVTARGWDHTENFEQTTVHVNNPPRVPAWASAVSAGRENNRPYVDLAWHYDGSEPDLREFQVVRTGPGGTAIWSVSSTAPAKQGCSVSGSSGDKTYSCRDAVFASGGYGGTYSYKVWALRASPVGPDACRLDQNGDQYLNGATRLCIGRATSSAQAAAVEEPSPTPGTDGGGNTGGNTGGGNNTKTSGRNTGFVDPGPGTRVLGGQRSTAPNTDYRDFYTGEYKNSLPYQDRTIILPDGTRIQAGGKETTTQITSSDNPLGVPLRDRNVLLPLAGGLLLFLGAAHVKRLLTDR